MRRVILALLFGIPALTSQAAPTAAGRWEGAVEIPGRELTLVVDVAQDAQGAWSGSIIMPGLRIRGAPLANLAVTASEVRFDTGDALGGAEGKAAFRAHLTARGTMVGEMRQAGNVAKFVLNYSGPPQVELPRRSTAVAAEFEGQWSGDYELGGYPRHLTISLHNHPGAAASVQFVVVGKQTTNVSVDLVTQEGDLLSIESHEYGVNFAGRIAKPGEMDGTVVLGALEVPVVLHRVAGGSS